ncbi:tripartite tricarboxylate transporter permease, partial [Intestinimonas massiliensis]|uniref:tripartite tricarboxylate transporter permease n=1 Tax=Intestinimonas massiliensis (ex Afouda et al. 2020) TaxID=1673721 RepID=UPI00210C1981
ALSIALRGSVVGGLFSGVCLLFFAPQLANLALKFGAPDYFMLTVFGLTIIASVSGKSMVQQIKEKSKERKALLAEKKETPFYQILELHDLTRRITE